MGVALDHGGAADGIAITSARQPLVDDLTVRQTGAIAYGLSALVNDRIVAQQSRSSQEPEAARLPRQTSTPTSSRQLDVAPCPGSA